jgi:hypothetical protein
MANVMFKAGVSDTFPSSTIHSQSTLCIHQLKLFRTGWNVALRASAVSDCTTAGSFLPPLLTRPRSQIESQTLSLARPGHVQLYPNSVSKNWGQSLMRVCTEWIFYHLHWWKWCPLVRIVMLGLKRWAGNIESRSFKRKQILVSY